MPRFHFLGDENRSAKEKESEFLSGYPIPAKDRHYEKNNDDEVLFYTSNKHDKKARK